MTEEQRLYQVTKQMVLARLSMMGYIIREDYGEEDAHVVAVAFFKEDGTSYVYTLYPMDFMRDYIVEHVVFHINNMLKTP